MMFTIIAYSQKKKNGTVYNEHPAIIMVEDLQKASIEGDTIKVAMYLADNFRFFDGTADNRDFKGTTKQQYINWAKWNKENIAYGKVFRQAGAYPDAIEYKDDESGLWVQTWDVQRGIHEKTGVKLDRPVHTLYSVNADNKVAIMIEYSDNPFREIRNSNAPRTNGTIYNNHEYINKVRRMMGAFENNDPDTAYSFFDKDARISNINMPIGESHSIAEDREGYTKMMETYDVISVDVRGYPDYMEYELGNAKVVYSWWNIRLLRKKDKKEFVIPAHYSHRFNDEGMIINETGYYSLTHLEDKKDKK